MSITEDSFQTSRKERHVRYFKRILTLVPGEMASLDSTRLQIAFFTLNGMDILDSLHPLDENKKREMIDWVYRLQIQPEYGETEGQWKHCGFQGSTTLIFPKNVSKCSNEYVCSHIAMTYTGLCILLILGDDLSRVHRSAVIEGVRALQQEDGSFCSSLAGSENDMRFVYCAASICYILNDWSGMDVEKTVKFIKRSTSYDCGIAQHPENESHCGSTFCAIASLSLMGKLDTAFTERELKGLRRWVMARQVGGFQGRPNKPADTCYSFWVGATLKMLGLLDCVNTEENRSHILTTEDSISGGFSKWWDTLPDPLHTCLGLGGLSLMNEKGLLAVHPALILTMRALKNLEAIQQRWEA